MERLVTRLLFLAGRSQSSRHFCVPLILDTKLFGQERRNAPGFIGGGRRARRMPHGPRAS